MEIFGCSLTGRPGTTFDVGAGCLHNLPHFTKAYFTGARLLNGG